eukprot:TRINITY_DN11155_c0_g1_i1.p1 TRINITY_DN11155_c0_g1~~TRINITY_DN11155_c0_g1_i1.p1  ORF type:complete len:258 (-),score=36.86 TRINITY_DN11155_c0_g1_i1:507-1280(-)
MELPVASKSGSLIELSFRRLYQKCQNTVQTSLDMNSVAKDPKFHAQVEKLQELITDMQHGQSMRIDDGILKQYKECVKQLGSCLVPYETPGFMKVNHAQQVVPVAAIPTNGNSNHTHAAEKVAHASEEVLREGLGLRQRAGGDEDTGRSATTTMQESLQQDLIQDLGDLVSNLKTNVTQVNTHITQRGKLLDDTHHKLDANVERAKQAIQTATTINVQTSMGLCQRLKLVLLMLFILGIMTAFMVSNKLLRRILWLQ